MTPEPAPSGGLLDRSRRAVCVLALMAGVLGLDRLTKILASDALEGEGPRDLLGGLVRLLYQENHGAMLSLGAELPESIRFLFFTVLVSLVLLALLAAVLLKRTLSTSDAVAAALIVGGGMGNVLDRIFFDGAVIDFLNVGIGELRTGVFNLADVAILCGVAVFLLGRKQHASQGPHP